MLDLGHWFQIKDADPRARAMYLGHYSARHYKDGRRRSKFIGPGEYMLLMTTGCDALFAWRKFKDDAQPPQTGVNNPIFIRKAGDNLASDLIREACEIAWTRWPGERLYTYVNPKKVRSTNPGYCYLKAGWRKCGKTKGGLLIFEVLPTASNWSPTLREPPGLPLGKPPHIDTRVCTYET